MELRVFDTYVKDGKGKTMHFDVLIHQDKDRKFAIDCAKEYLKDIKHAKISSDECSFCHIQTATPEQSKAVANGGEKINDKPPVNQGYVIIKMSDNCP